MSDTNEIEKKIRAISKKEAEKAWEEMYDESMENLGALIRGTLQGDCAGRVYLERENEHSSKLGVVYFTGNDRNRNNIPNNYYHRDHGVYRIEFTTELLKNAVKARWIEKEADRLATLKINHLLASVGV